MRSTEQACSHWLSNKLDVILVGEGHAYNLNSICMSIYQSIFLLCCNVYNTYFIRSTLGRIHTQYDHSKVATTYDQVGILERGCTLIITIYTIRNYIPTRGWLYDIQYITSRNYFSSFVTLSQCFQSRRHQRQNLTRFLYMWSDSTTILNNSREQCRFMG